MAEAFLNERFADFFETCSGGLEPGEVDPIISQVMAEIGIDFPPSPSKTVFEIFKAGKTFAYVISICDERSAEPRPIFPGVVTALLHWRLPDPSALQGTPQEKLARSREIRDELKLLVENWCAEFLPIVD